MGDNWYCLIFGEELGPMSWDDLLAMAAHGTLGKRERVKQGEHAEWMIAESIAGLFPASSAPRASAADAASEPSAEDDTDFDIDASLVSAGSPAPAASDDADFDLAPSVKADSEAETDFEIAGPRQAHAKATPAPPKDLPSDELSSNDLDFDLSIPSPGGAASATQRAAESESSAKHAPDTKK